MSVLNSFFALSDWLVYGRAVANQELNDEPVFVLGHPRTGTTHLHNLLSKDERFAFATTFSVGFPSSFLCLRAVAPGAVRACAGAAGLGAHLALEAVVEKRRQVAVGNHHHVAAVAAGARRVSNDTWVADITAPLP